MTGAELIEQKYLDELLDPWTKSDYSDSKKEQLLKLIMEHIQFHLMQVKIVICKIFLNLNSNEKGRDSFVKSN